MKSMILCDNAMPDKVIPLCTEYGLGIEVQSFYNPNEIDQTDARIATYQQMLPDGIERYLHAPFWDLCLGSATTQIVDVTRHYFDYAYQVAEALDCRGVIVHHGYVAHTSYPPNWIQRSFKFWQNFFTDHPGHIQMFMENQCEHHPETLMGIIDGFGDARLGVNLDIGHAHCNNPLDVMEWVKLLGHRIQYVHIHQNHGQQDEHLGLHDGNIPMLDVLNLLETVAPDAIWALECNVDAMRDSIEYLLAHRYIK